MTWQRLTLCFELLGPLHVGFLPNRPGTVVAQTRCYLPGKNLWGAVTAGLTSKMYANPTIGHFRHVGKSIREQVFFSYFYLSDGHQIFRPDYTSDGLTWGNLPDPAFRSRFTGSHVSTAIGETGGAEDTTLHEIEFIRHRIGSPARPSQKVLLIGFIWIRGKAAICQQTLVLRDGTALLGKVDLIEEIVVGGERNYGFGRLQRADVPEPCRNALGVYFPEDPETSMTFGPDRPLIAHVAYREDVLFRGDLEIVAGREYRGDGDGQAFQRPGERMSSAGYYFVPGTRLNGGAAQLRMDSWGRWMWV